MASCRTLEQKIADLKHTIVQLLPQAYLREGWKTYKAEKYNAAEQCFSKAIETLPNNKLRKDAHYGRGLTYLTLGELGHAIRDFDTLFTSKDTLRKDCSYVRSDNRVLDAYLCNAAQIKYEGDVKKVKRNFAKALSLDKEHPETYFERGIFFSEWGYNKEAIDDFSAFLDLASDNEPLPTEKMKQAYHNRGKCYLAIGERKKAIQDFASKLILDPESDISDLIEAKKEENYFPTEKEKIIVRVKDYIKGTFRRYKLAAFTSTLIALGLGGFIFGSLYSLSPECKDDPPQIYIDFPNDEEESDGKKKTAQFRVEDDSCSGEISRVVLFDGSSIKREWFPEEREMSDTFHLEAGHEYEFVASDVNDNLALTVIRPETVESEKQEQKNWQGSYERCTARYHQASHRKKELKRKLRKAKSKLKKKDKELEETLQELGKEKEKKMPKRKVVVKEVPKDCPKPVSWPYR